MKLGQLLFLTIFSILCFFACETAVPADQYFCKAEEVYVLEEAFDLESAIIVMYKGDDVLLLGDTIYKEIAPKDSLDSVRIDSSQFYVKVKAKRGVIGWVNASELQHERPKAPPTKPAAPVKTPPQVKVKVDSFAVLDSLLQAAKDSLNSSLLGSYIYLKDSSDYHSFRLFAIDSAGWSFQWKIGHQCDTLIKAKAKLNGRKLIWQSADSCKWHFEWLSENRMSIKAESNCKSAICLPKGSLSKKKNSMTLESEAKEMKSDSAQAESIE
jgi:hypothetical protein